MRSAFEKLYRVVSGNSCFGVIVVNDTIVKTAPIGQWLLGKTVPEAMRMCFIQRVKEIKLVEKKVEKKERKPPRLKIKRGTEHTI